jgi:tetratricopeptide (TPR) repeat protein
MSDQSYLIGELKREIAQQRVLIIAGAGVSIGATKNEQCASWTGLLKHGAERCEQIVPNLQKGWKKRVYADIDSGDLIDLLSATEKISQRLGAPVGGQFKRWLRESVGALKVKDDAVIKALHNLNNKIATTNYDSLIEEVTELPPVTWLDGNEVERFLRGDKKAVLHLHGYWEKSESVILSIRSYEKILADAHAQEMQKLIATSKTILFVGCGDGLIDPNFGLLLEWLGDVFTGSEYNHYCLARPVEAKRIRGQHTGVQNFHVIEYEEHDKLAGFLGSLASNQAVIATPAANADLSNPVVAPIPSGAYKLRCFGREKELKELIDTLLSEIPEPTPILGQAGIGKTTLSLAAYHDERVKVRYERRLFIRCDGLTQRSAIVAAIAQELGLTPSPNIEPTVLFRLAEVPTLLVLDNAETPYENDLKEGKTEVEELFALLVNIEGLALVASFRGKERPITVSWREPIEPQVLDLPAARETFLNIAGEQLKKDLHLDSLLAAVDRLPIAIMLLASEAQGEPNLESIRQLWQEKRTKMLKRAGGKNRLTNIELSYEISIQGIRMTNEARRLLYLLAMLPAGLAQNDIAKVFPAQGYEAALKLNRVGLSFYDESTRLRLLAPLREYVSRNYPPETSDVNQMIEYFVNLAKEGGKAGTSEGAITIENLTPEVQNIEAMLELSLKGENPSAAILAAPDWAKFISYTGTGSPQIIEQAITCAEAEKDLWNAAECIRSLGDIALRQSDNDKAQSLYEQAIPLFKQVGDLLGEANCIRSLGDIALRQSDNDKAQSLYEQAIPLFKQVGSLLGEANCIRSLGEIALRQSDNDKAQSLYEQAIPLYKQVGSLLGEANCIKGLGDIAFYQSGNDKAQSLYEQAIPLFKQVGSLLGEANCIRSLGEIALRQSDNDKAQSLYEQAIPLFKQVGDLLGEANCISSLGDIALRQSDNDKTQSFYQDAMEKYQKISDRYSIAWAYYRFALITTKEEQKRHLQSARAIAEDLKMKDLIKYLDDEFGKEKE